MGPDVDEYLCPDRPGRKPSLQARLQSGKSAWKHSVTSYYWGVKACQRGWLNALFIWFSANNWKVGLTIYLLRNGTFSNTFSSCRHESPNLFHEWDAVWHRISKFWRGISNKHNWFISSCYCFTKARDWRGMDKRVKSPFLIYKGKCLLLYLIPVFNTKVLQWRCLICSLSDHWHSH